MKNGNKTFNLVFFLITLSLICSSRFVFADSLKNWKLVYEHDEQGIQTFGNINRLISESLHGSDVKVILRWSNAQDHTVFPCDKVSINTSSNLVTCWKPNQVLHPEDTESVIQVIQIFYTTGEYKAVYPSGTLPQYWDVAMSWYVNK